MDFNKKGKGIVASSLVFSAVAPQTMSTQAFSFKDVKQTVTEFFMRTFLFLVC